LIRRPVARESAEGQPAVDVIVNNYNYGEYVGEAIASAVRQTYPNVRVIVVDDGSTDGSRGAIELYENDVVAIFKPNGGQASAFNAGIERSEGDIAIFLDADDVLLPETCAKVVGVFQADSSVARVQYPMEVIDTDGRRTNVMKPPLDVRLPSGDLRRQALAFPFDVPWMATSGNAFATETLRRIFPVPESEYRILADWYVVHLTTLLGKVASLEGVGAYRRVHSRNLHELAQPALDLAHLRQVIVAAAHTRRYLEALARELESIDDNAHITSFSDIGNRMISLRLAPSGHPISTDRRYGLTADGIRSALRRFDVSPPMRLLLGLWLVAEAVAPRFLAVRLAELFLFSERRKWFHPILVALRRR
jgi:glycosyltransferase involved in cell wall biosynthesis